MQNTEEKIQYLENKVQELEARLNKVYNLFKFESELETEQCVVTNVAEKQHLKLVPQQQEAKQEAKEEDLDDKYNNPDVKRNPPGWKGESFVGKRFSECTPEFLNEMAGFLEWAADDDKKNNIMTAAGKPRYKYRLLDAKRARDWALKIKEGNSPKVQKEISSDYNFDDVPIT